MASYWALPCAGRPTSACAGAANPDPPNQIKQAEGFPNITTIGMERSGHDHGDDTGTVPGALLFEHPVPKAVPGFLPYGH